MNDTFKACLKPPVFSTLNKKMSKVKNGIREKIFQKNAEEKAR
jgi:hypothetical protein